jgi:hypothetical protein
VSCAQPHPDHPRILCDKGVPCYGYHANAALNMVWPGNPLPEPAPAEGRTRKGQLALIAQRAQR